MNRLDIFKLIDKERQKQTAKFGLQNRTLIEWCVILGEEVGEVNRAALENNFKDEYPEIYTKSKDQCISDFKKELIQVAALSVQILETL